MTPTEQMARHLCKQSGQDPDMLSVLRQDYGVALAVLPTHIRPLWEWWAKTAERALAFEAVPEDAEPEDIVEDEDVPAEVSSWKQDRGLTHAAE